MTREQPRLKLGDHVRIMQTSAMEARRASNVLGRVIRLDLESATVQDAGGKRYLGVPLSALQKWTPRTRRKT